MFLNLQTGTLHREYRLSRRVKCAEGTAKINAINRASVVKIVHGKNSFAPFNPAVSALAFHPEIELLSNLSQFSIINARFDQISVQSCSSLDNSEIFKLAVSRHANHQRSRN